MCKHGMSAFANTIKSEANTSNRPSGHRERDTMVCVCVMKTLSLYSFVQTFQIAYNERECVMQSSWFEAELSSVGLDLFWFGFVFGAIFFSADIRLSFCFVNKSSKCLHQFQIDMQTAHAAGTSWIPNTFKCYKSINFLFRRPVFADKSK